MSRANLWLSVGSAGWKGDRLLPGETLSKVRFLAAQGFFSIISWGFHPLCNVRQRETFHGDETAGFRILISSH